MPLINDSPATKKLASFQDHHHPRELILASWYTADNTRLLPLVISHHSALLGCVQCV
jgi:hypothetical protein